jgi:parallel beta-helix repeat protein
MNTQSELERIVRDWLEERVAEPRPAGLERVLERLPTTTQHRRRWLDRWIGRGQGAMRSARDRGGPSGNDDTRRDRLMITATGLVAGAGALALAVTLVIPGDRDGARVVPGAGTGAAHVVAQDGSGDFATIGEALAAAADGDTILVRPGEYVEALVIDKDITLSGDGAAGSVVIAIPADAPTMVVEEWMEGGRDARVGILLDSTDASVTNVSLAGGENAISVLVAGGAPTLSDLRVTVPALPEGAEGDARRAFHFMGASTPTLMRSTWDGYLAVRGGAAPTIEDNVVTGVGHLSIDGPGETTLRNNTLMEGTGTSLSADASGLVEGNDVTGTSIVVDSGSDIVVRGNTLRGVSTDSFTPGAIVVAGAGSSATVSGNTVTDSTTGIAVTNGADATVEGNTLIDNGLGIMASTRDVTVDGNTVRGSSTGVAISGGVVTGNTIEGNETGLRINGNAAVTISGNTLCENGVNVRTSGDDAVSLEGNEVCPETGSPG